MRRDRVNLVSFGIPLNISLTKRAYEMCRNRIQHLFLSLSHELMHFFSLVCCLKSNNCILKSSKKTARQEDRNTCIFDKMWGAAHSIGTNTVAFLHMQSSFEFIHSKDSWKYWAVCFMRSTASIAASQNLHTTMGYRVIHHNFPQLPMFAIQNVCLSFVTIFFLIFSKD